MENQDVNKREAMLAQRKRQLKELKARKKKEIQKFASLDQMYEAIFNAIIDRTPIPTLSQADKKATLSHLHYSLLITAISQVNWQFLTFCQSIHDPELQNILFQQLLSLKPASKQGIGHIIDLLQKISVPSQAGKLQNFDCKQPVSQWMYDILFERLSVLAKIPVLHPIYQYLQYEKINDRLCHSDFESLTSEEFNFAMASFAPDLSTRPVLRHPEIFLSRLPQLTHHKSTRNAFLKEVNLMDLTTAHKFFNALKDKKQIRFNPLHLNYSWPTEQLYKFYVALLTQYPLAFQSFRSRSFFQHCAMMGTDLTDILPIISKDFYQQVGREWPNVIAQFIEMDMSDAMILSLMKRHEWVQTNRFYYLVLAKNRPDLIPNNVNNQRAAVTALSDCCKVNQARKTLLSKVDYSKVPFQLWIRIEELYDFQYPGDDVQKLNRCQIKHLKTKITVKGQVLLFSYVTGIEFYRLGIPTNQRAFEKCMLLMNSTDVRNSLMAGHYKYIEYAISKSIKDQKIDRLKVLYREMYLFYTMRHNDLPEPFLESFRRLDRWQPILLQKVGPVFIKHSKSQMQAKHLVYLLVHNIICQHALYQDSMQNTLFKGDIFLNLVAEQDRYFPLFKRVYTTMGNFFFPKDLCRHAIEEGSVQTVSFILQDAKKVPSSLPPLSSTHFNASMCPLLAQYYSSPCELKAEQFDGLRKIITTTDTATTISTIHHTHIKALKEKIPITQLLIPIYHKTPRIGQSICQQILKQAGKLSCNYLPVKLIGYIVEQFVDYELTKIKRTELIKLWIKEGKVEKVVGMLESEKYFQINHEAMNSFLQRESLQEHTFQRLFAYFYTSTSCIEPIQRKNRILLPDGSFFSDTDFRVCIRSIARQLDHDTKRKLKEDRILITALSTSGPRRSIIMEELGQRLHSWQALLKRRCIPTDLPQSLVNVIKPEITHFDYRKQFVLFAVAQFDKEKINSLYLRPSPTGGVHLLFRVSPLLKEYASGLWQKLLSSQLSDQKKNSRIVGKTLAQLRAICKSIDIRQWVNPNLAKKLILVKRQKRVIPTLEASNIVPCFLQMQGSAFIKTAQSRGITASQAKSELLASKECLSKIVNDHESNILEWIGMGLEEFSQVMPDFLNFCIKNKLAYWLKYMIEKEWTVSLDKALLADKKLAKISKHLAVRLWWLSGRSQAPQQPIPKSTLYPQQIKVDMMLYWRYRQDHPCIYEAIFKKKHTNDPLINELFLWRYNQLPRKISNIDERSLAVFMIRRMPFNIEPTKEITALAFSELSDVPSMRDITQQDITNLTFTIMSSKNATLKYWFLKGTDYLAHFKQRQAIFATDLAATILAKREDKLNLELDMYELEFIRIVEQDESFEGIFQQLRENGITQNFYHNIELMLKSAQAQFQELQINIFKPFAGSVQELILATIKQFDLPAGMFNIQSLALELPVKETIKIFGFLEVNKFMMSAKKLQQNIQSKVNKVEYSSGPSHITYSLTPEPQFRITVEFVKMERGVYYSDAVGKLQELLYSDKYIHQSQVLIHQAKSREMETSLKQMAENIEFEVSLNTSSFEYISEQVKEILRVLPQQGFFELGSIQNPQSNMELIRFTQQLHISLSSPFVESYQLISPRVFQISPGKSQQSFIETLNNYQRNFNQWSADPTKMEEIGFNKLYIDQRNIVGPYAHLTRAILLKREAEATLKFNLGDHVLLCIFSFLRSISQASEDPVSVGKQMLDEWLLTTIAEQILSIKSLKGLERKQPLISFQGKGKKLKQIKYHNKQNLLFLQLQFKH